MVKTSSKDLLNAVHDVAHNLKSVANAITPLSVGMGHDETGGAVASLTEAVMGITAGLVRIAESISELADAVRSCDETIGPVRCTSFHKKSS